MSALLAPFLPYIIGAVGFLAVIGAAFFKGRADGSKRVRDAIAQARLEARTEADKIDDAVAGMSDAEVLRRQKEWSKR